MLEVIGVGFGRTGTLSLKRALETLGFRKCYHFTEMVRARHSGKWLRIADGYCDDWNTVFNRYRATTDWPAAAYYRELATAYPQAKLVLTVRDADAWYDSIMATIVELRRVMPERWPGIGSVARVADRIVWNGVFEGRINDRNYAIARFNQHIEEVQRIVPNDRLLVFDVREGWEPLCQFLGVSAPPGIEFPRVNDRRRMRLYIRWMKRLRWAVPAIAAIAILAAIVFMLLG